VLGVVVVVAAVVSGLGFFWPFGRKGSELRLPGTVEIQEVRLGSKIGGRVAAVLVTEGEVVRPGQELVRLEVPELEAQAEQLRARVRTAAAELEEARTGARQEEKEAAQAAEEAARARLELLLAGSRPEEVHAARDEVEAAQADLRQAQEDIVRLEQSLRGGGSTPTEMAAARAYLERSRARTAAARARLELLLAGSRPEDIARAEAELRQAEANHRLVLAGSRSEKIQACEARLAEAEAKLREAEVNLKEAVVRAPEAAVVEVVSVRPGDLVSANQSMLRVLRTADLWVKIYVRETDLGKVRLGQEVEATVDSHPGQRFRGRVVQIGSESEFTPRNVQSLDERHHQVFGVRVRVEDPQGVFKSGMAAEVYLPLQD
jgi:multidrug resistance efflux pump